LSKNGVNVGQPFLKSIPLDHYQICIY